MAMLVLAVLMFSAVPTALAEQGNGNGNGNGQIETEDNNEIEDETENNAEVEEVTEDNTNTEDSWEEKGVKAVEKAQERFSQAREKFEQAKNKYLDAKVKIQEHKEELTRVKEKVKSCKNGENETCQGFKTELNKGVQQHLLKTVDLIDSSLQRLIERVESSDTLSEEEKQAALTRINELEAELTVKKEAVQAMTETATNEELKAAIKDLKELWQDVSKEQKLLLASLINSRLDNLANVKLPEFDNAMTLRIDEIKELGGDTTELEAIQERYNDAMDQLQEDQADAKKMWTEYKLGEATSEEWRTAQQKVREGLSDSKEIIREFLTQYREQKQELNAVAETEPTTAEE